MENVWDQEWAYSVRFEGPLTTVIVENLQFGVKAVGHALCNFDDRFDENYGEALASIRAFGRAYKKLEKILTKTFGS